MYNIKFNLNNQEINIPSTEKITTNISDNLESHNTATTAHADIRNLIKSVPGRTPIITPLVDWTAPYNIANNTALGHKGIGTPAKDGNGNLYIRLKQSYKNFDKILFRISNSTIDAWVFRLFDTKELQIAFEESDRIWICDYGVNCTFYGCKKTGTNSHVLSNDTVWYFYSTNLVMGEIYGFKY